MISWLVPFNTSIWKKQQPDWSCSPVHLRLFLVFNRIPKLDKVEEDLEAVAAHRPSASRASA